MNQINGTSFDAAAWLERFAQVGGGYYTNDHGLYLGWLNPSFPDPDNRTAKQMACSLSPDQHAAVADHVAAMQADREPSKIIAAWERIKAARLAYNAAPMDSDEAETAFDRAMNYNEPLIANTIATTARELEIVMWLHLLHIAHTNRDEADIFAEDVDALSARRDTLDFNQELLVSAITALRAGIN